MLPQTRILRAVIAAVRPRGHGFDQPIDDDVLRDIQRFLPYLPWPLRLGLPFGLWLVELGPPLFARRWCRFTSMAPGEAARYLATFQHAGGLRSALLMGLRTLVFLAFYEHPQVLASLGIASAGRPSSSPRDAASGARRSSTAACRGAPPSACSRAGSATWGSRIRGPGRWSPTLPRPSASCTSSRTTRTPSVRTRSSSSRGRGGSAGPRRARRATCAAAWASTTACSAARPARSRPCT